MVDVKLKLTSNSSAILHILCNGSEIISDLTNETNREAFVKMEGNGYLCIYNSYKTVPPEKTTILKKIIAYCIYGLMRAWSYTDSWNIPFVVREDYFVNVYDDDAAIIKIRFVQTESETPPCYRIEPIGCDVVKKSSSICVDGTELEVEYTERKKAQSMFGIFPIFILIILSAFSALCSNYTTAIFTGIIDVIFICALWYARTMLNKKWRKYQGYVHRTADKRNE